MNDDFKNPGLKATGSGKDYYTKLWEESKVKAPPTLVTVNLSKSSAMLGTGLVLRVQVYSQVLKGRVKQAEKQISRHETIANLRILAGMMAAALSEHCSNDYGDDFTPTEYERMGMDAFNQIIEKLEGGDLTIGMVTG